MESRASGSVRDRIERVLAIFVHNDAPFRGSIAEFCRLAGISRSNLYAHHSDIVHHLRRRFPHSRSRREPPSKGRDLQAEVHALQETVTALRIICSELNCSLLRAQSELDAFRTLRTESAARSRGRSVGNSRPCPTDRGKGT